MATKRKKPRKRPYTPPAPRAGAASAVSAPAAAPQTGTPARTAPQRRQFKEEARKARERQIRQYRRAQAIRRFFTISVIAIVVVGLFFLLTRVGKPELSDATTAAMEAAGCVLDEQTDRGGGHVAPYVYEDKPATSGAHDPSPLEAGIYTEPQPEERVVHSLEHAYAVIYYRADDPDKLADDVLTALEGVAEDEDKVVLAPYAELPTGTTLAFAGWNWLLTCPGDVDADQAETIAQGFIEEFRGSKRAPEPNAA